MVFKLRSKLVIFYGGLFSVALVMLAFAAQLAVVDYAQTAVQREMSAATSVFTRLWTLRSDTLRTNAELLARDFGFQSALASSDIPTLESAFDNLKGRLGADEGVIVDVTGGLLTGGDSPVASKVAEILTREVPIKTKSGIMTTNQQAYSVVIAPVLAPDPIGWLVFATKLDQKEMAALESMSSIALTATLIHADKTTDWSPSSHQSSDASGKALPDDLSDVIAQSDGKSKAVIVLASGEKVIAAATPMPVLAPESQSQLLLTYPLKLALSDYERLILILTGLGLVTLVAVIGASLVVARTLTRPIQRLDMAVRQLQNGERAKVDISGQDEISDLAQSFNAMAQSISERETKIMYMARHDLTTNLPNRAAFEEAVAMEVERGAFPIVLAIGLDRFSQIRSIWGVATSTRVITALSDLILTLCPTSTIARLGPDVLGLVIKAEASLSREEAMIMAQPLATVLDTRVTIDEQVVDISVVIGIEAASEAAFGAHELIERAMIGLDQARAGKHKIAAFDARVFDDMADNALLTQDLHEAIEAQQLMAYYQPKYDYRARTINGLEALVRWDHATRGMVSPQKFVLIAEETGFIRDLTWAVLRHTIRDQARLKALGYDLAISVNYSGRLLTDPDYTERTIEICAEAVGKICLEITETAVIEDPKLGLAAIERFVEAGLEISIDDFGTGLSSLSYLKLIPAHELKIDRSFIVEMDKGQRERILVASTINLAHGLGMKVTAEGVEDDLTLTLLAGMGCDMAQGYGIAKPMAFEALVGFLNQTGALSEKHKALNLEVKDGLSQSA